MMLIAALPTSAAALSSPCTAAWTTSVKLTAMTFNAWGGGEGQATSLNDTAAAIRAAKADIVGVQETRREGDPCTAENCPPAGTSIAKKLAELLGFFYYDQTAVNAALWANAVLSRYPIVADSATTNDIGVKIRVDNDTEIYAFNVHFTDYPYQPYQLMRIPYGDSPYLTTAAEAVAAAKACRSKGLNLLLHDIAEVQQAGYVSFVFGDFNEPTVHDWNQAAVDAGLQPLVVQWPTTLAVETAGFVDAYRAVYPDVVAKPAFTFTPTTSDPPDKHDRIDQLLVRGAVVIEDAWIVGEKTPEADLVYVPWPSDHRAVAARIRIDTCHYPGWFWPSVYAGSFAAVALVLCSIAVTVCWVRKRRVKSRSDFLLLVEH